MYGCALLRRAIERPTVDFQNLNITDIDFTSITTAFNFQITNPNPVGLRVDGFEYQFVIEGKQFLSGNNPDRLELAAGEESIVSIPITLKYIDVYEVVTTLAENEGRIPYNISGKFFFNTPIGRIPIPFSKSGELPVLKMPKISLANISLKNLSLRRADIVFNLKFENPNIFAIAFDNFSYNLSLNQQQLVEGITNHEIPQIFTDKKKRKNNLAKGNGRLRLTVVISCNLQTTTHAFGLAWFIYVNSKDGELPTERYGNFGHAIQKNRLAIRTTREDCSF